MSFGSSSGVLLILPSVILCLFAVRVAFVRILFAAYTFVGFTKFASVFSISWVKFSQFAF